jgi:hypothetical protein
VEKDLFTKVLHNYPSSTAEEAQELLSLKERFPYSQLLHVLSARASKDHGFSHQQNELQLAAVYSADRGILKHMMSGKGYSNGAVEPHPTSLTNAVSSGKKDEKPPQNGPTAEIESETDDLAERVIKDIKELYETRHNFEVMFVDNPGTSLGKSANSVHGEDQPDLSKSKRERIIELSKTLNTPPAAEEIEEIKPIKKKREARKDIIDEIVNTKTKIEPESEKQKEQLEIIDHFIKAQPSISNSKDKPLIIQDGDLAIIKAGEFGDNIVSETLVEILLKQGKKDKAIEVLKKLIWKFPQKKTYFAAQIEELKK